jgi:hypothetical protein
MASLRVIPPKKFSPYVQRKMYKKIAKVVEEVAGKLIAHYGIGFTIKYTMAGESNARWLDQYWLVNPRISIGLDGATLWWIYGFTDYPSLTDMVKKPAMESLAIQYLMAHEYAHILNMSTDGFFELSPTTIWTTRVRSIRKPHGSEFRKLYQDVIDNMVVLPQRSHSRVTDSVIMIGAASF